MADEYGSSYQSDEQAGSPPTSGSSNWDGGSGTTTQAKQSGGQMIMDPDADTPSRGMGFYMPLGKIIPGANLNEVGEYASEEAYGEAPVPVGGVEATAETAEMSEEIGNPEAAEGSEEFYEATPEQLAVSSGESAQEVDEEGLFDVVSNIASTLFESTEITEAGEALDGAQEAGQEEFFPFLAALVPTLISSIGPMVAKKVMSKLSPAAKQGVKRIAATAVKAVGQRSKPVRNIMGVFSRLLESAENKPGAESGMELGEEVNGLIDEAVSTLEVIIGHDDRVLFKDTTAEPLRRICELRITFPNGKTFRGTGFFIGKRTLATAGHCVYLHNQGGWARKIEVIPAINGSTRPYGSAVATTFRSVKGWVNSKKPEHDYGCIVLPAGAFGGRNLGKFGFAALDGKQLLGQTAYLKGYPGDKPSQNWGMHRGIKTVTSKTLIYDIDTVGGQSGAPVYIRKAGKRYVIGIHNYGNAGGNSATRVTPTVYERLQKWSAL